MIIIYFNGFPTREKQQFTCVTNLLAEMWAGLLLHLYKKNTSAGENDTLLKKMCLFMLQLVPIK